MIPVAELIKNTGLTAVSGDCPEHGHYETFAPSGFQHKCPECVLSQAAKEYTQMAQTRRVGNLRERSGIPDRYRGAGFKNFDATTPEKQRVLASLRSEYTNFAIAWAPILLSGPVGTGKTHLICALANNLIESGVSVRYTTMATMLADIKRAYSTDGMTEASQIAKYADSFDLLVIDEADVIRGSENDLGLVFAVINGRYNAMRPVATISNQPVDKLADFLGARTVDRLAENATRIICDWESYRAAKAA